jgi:hypothetical protein
MKRRIWTATALGAALVALTASAPADAGLLPVKVQLDPDGGNWRYTYGVVLTSDSYITAGDFFTIYDFAGFVPASNTQPDGFTFSSTPTGKTPLGTTPFDDPRIPNLTWTYNGPTRMDGQVGLGNFTAISTIGETTEGNFTARTHRQVDDRIDSNITDTLVPMLEGGGPQVPEPATLTMFGLVLPVVAGRYLRRRKA